MSEQALRYNAGKPELSYILDADYAIEGICEVLKFGSVKYDRNNYKKGFPKEQLANSLLRHLTKFLNGEELDEESGLPHVDHIGCNSLFLAYHFNGRKAKAECNTTEDQDICFSKLISQVKNIDWDSDTSRVPEYVKTEKDFIKWVREEL